VMLRGFGSICMIFTGIKNSHLIMQRKNLIFSI
jgi:hypothetical protein